MKLIKSAGSVWDDIAEDSGEAMQLKIQSSLLTALKKYASEVKSNEFAKPPSLLEPNSLLEIEEAVVNTFTIDELVKMAEHVGVNTLKIEEK